MKNNFNNKNGDPDAPIKKDHDQSIEPNFDDDFSDNKSSYRVPRTNRSSMKKETTPHP
jgi:hypothetical protein